MVNFQVAIDGPAGSGKSSISQVVAKKLGFVHIDTGAMYRAVTLEALRRNIDFDDKTQYDFIDEISIKYVNDVILLNGEDVSKEIRSVEVTNLVSKVSTFEKVRTKMVHFQQLSAMNGLVLMDGRDIGTVVLKNADVKIFLTADPVVRANRRLLEMKSKSINLTFEEVYNDLINRDFKDINRKISPLKQAEDALVIDTTNMTIDQVVDKIIEIVGIVKNCMKTNYKN